MATSKHPEPTTDPPEGGSSDSILLRWLGDESRYTDGIPNRDVTTADVHLSKDDLARAVKHGNHEKVS